VFDPPAIAFARSGDAHLAYQVTGQGPPDLVYVAGSFATTVQWQEHAYARGFRRLASFSRLVTFDQRGMGYSDPIDPAAGPSVAQLVTDLESVISAVGVTEPILFGTHNGGAVAAAYAARHPVRRLILCNTWARLKVADDYPIGFDDAVLAHIERRYRDNWGEGRIANYWAHPRPEIETRRMELTSTSRNQALTLFYMNRDYDIRSLLPAIRAPTLVVHLEDNMMIPPGFGRYIAEHIPAARLELLPGGDHMFMRNHADEVIDVVESFVTGTRTVFMDRLTTTMLFTDIVDSTPTAAALGDARWSELIDEHNDRVRRAVFAEGGHEVKCTGDGFLVAFEDSAAAVRCAQAALESVAGLGLELRAGVHVGEVSPMGSHDLAGLAVHFAQRLCGRAAGGQVLVSAAVRDACTGARLHFDPQGTAQLKGIPGEWEVFEVRPSRPGKRSPVA
jgi:class 3 adenylate cyclase